MVPGVGIDYAEVERELCRIPEVNAARIVTNADELPVEVHILASPEKHAKQVVRDIQSVAMASFGLDLDRRLISVVPLAGEKTNGRAGGGGGTLGGAGPPNPAGHPGAPPGTTEPHVGGGGKP